MCALPVLAPRVAIASSGLGHVQRGIESWASDLAAALAERGAPCVLFGGGEADNAQMTSLSYWKRGGQAARVSAHVARHLGGWRYYAGSAYELEQFTFSVALWRRIRHNFDILHVQDPLVADILNKLHRRGVSRPHVILANGTGETEDFLRRFPVIQQLTPYSVAGTPHVAAPGQLMFVIPNFIDVFVFKPGDRTAARHHFGLDEEGDIILCCAAIRNHHKRIDYLVREFEGFLSTRRDRPATLVLAGAREQDTDEIIGMARNLLGDRFRVFVDLPRQQMPLLYRAADMFVLTSLFEMFGTVLIEAMASGLPVLCHDTPAFRFVVGPAGHFRNLTANGALRESFIAVANPDARALLAASARHHVETNFSKPVVVNAILRMYEAVASG